MNIFFQKRSRILMNSRCWSTLQNKTGMRLPWKEHCTVLHIIDHTKICRRIQGIETYPRNNHHCSRSGRFRLRGSRSLAHGRPRSGWASDNWASKQLGLGAGGPPGCWAGDPRRPREAAGLDPEKKTAKTPLAAKSSANCSETQKSLGWWLVAFGDPV